MKAGKFCILLVDDEKDILEFLSYNLKKEGYVVNTATNGADAIKLATTKIPDLIVLDVMMPEMDGIETCIELRKIPKLQNTRIVFLTARNEDYSQIAGFESGADDYISKPVKPKLFISKLKAMFRRVNPEEITMEESKIIDLGRIKIDEEKFLVLVDNIEHFLPKKEFELLLLLSSKPNKVFTREEIFTHIWGSDVIVGERTIDVHIRKIREKLNVENIKTIKGVGYKFEN